MILNFDDDDYADEEELQQQQQQEEEEHDDDDDGMDVLNLIHDEEDRRGQFGFISGESYEHTKTPTTNPTHKKKNTNATTNEKRRTKNPLSYRGMIEQEVAATVVVIVVVINLEF